MNTGPFTRTPADVKYVESDISPAIVRCQECGTAWPNDELGCEAMLTHECEDE
jgi:hypothetical protein